MGASVKVHVWMATAGVGHKLGNGHSALELSNDGMTVYMSWMPRGRLKLINEASQGVGFYKIRDKSGKVVPNEYAIGTKNARSLKREIEIYKCPPHYSLDVPVCTIPASRDHENLFGVLPGRMARFWDTLLRTKPGHSARRHYPISTTKNCHGTVVELLREGGLEFYVVAPGNLIYQDARSLVQWVEKASKLINDMNAQHKSVINEMTANQYFQRVPQLKRSVPTYAEWRGESEYGISLFASRTDQIVGIDNHLKAYHRAVEKKDKGAQVRHLFNILWEASSHLKQKPNSKRRPAVQRLTWRVQAVLEDLFIKREREPVPDRVEDNAYDSDDYI